MVQSWPEQKLGLKQYFSNFRTNRKWPVLLLFTFIVPFYGCALWSKDAVVFHAINYPAPKPTNESTIPETIMVYRFLMDSSVDTHYLLISDQDSKTKVVSGHAWAQDPSAMLTALAIRDLESSGAFQKAVDQTSNVPYKYALEGAIKKFEGVVNKAKGSGLIEVEVKLIDFEPKSVGKNQLMKKDYVIEIRSVDTSPESLVKALKQGVNELSEKMRNDVRKSVTQDSQ
ncbi:MAG: ABC-type transport auxiliary lipoprotein family protein [Desulfomonilaceae bacterium]